MLHGPYYQWTRKIRGKTVTVRVTHDEAKQIEVWIENSRRLGEIVSKMERVALRITARSLRENQR